MKNTKIKQAVIFCGGFGTRIQHLSKKTPKPLIKFNGVKFLDYLLLNLYKFGFKEILLLCHYKSKKFLNFYHNKKIFEMKIKCEIEKTPLGTGGALFNIKRKLDKYFMVCNGDTYIDFNILKFINSFKKKKILIALQKTNNKKFNRVYTKKNKVINFSDISCKTNNLFNTGYAILDKSVLKYGDKKIFNLEKDFFNYFLKKNTIKYFIVDNQSKFIDIGTPRDFYRAFRFFRKLNNKPFIILDRDGIINFDKGHISNISQIKFIKNIEKLIIFFNDLNIPIFVVSNQSAVGRGLISEKKLNDIHEKIKEFFYKKNSYINKIYYCPHHVDSKLLKYRKNCKYRKPKIGFYKKIKKQWFLKTNKAIMIGDQQSDIEFAKKAKIIGLLFDKPKQDIFKSIISKKIIKKFIQNL